MTYRIQTKKSAVPESVPHPSELLPGELALNYSDMVLYAVGTDGAVHQISGSGGGGGLVAMNYTFWVKTVVSDLSLFSGIDDTSKVLAVNLTGFDVALNGVSLDPNIDYTIDEISVSLTEPAKVGDVLIVRNLVPSDVIPAGQSLNTSDIQTTGEDRPNRSSGLNLQTQQDVNWYLMDQIDGIEIPEIPELPEDLATTDDITAAIEGLASQDWVLDQDYTTEQVVNNSVTDAIVGLASEEWVLDQGFITDVSSYATTAYVTSSIEAVQRFATSADSAVLANAKKYTDDSIPVLEAHVPPKPICFNTQQGVAPSTALSPPEGKATFVNSPEIGGRQNGNLYFGNCNSCINIAKDQITNNVNQEFVEGESYEVVGFVTVYGKEDHKLYLKAPVARIVRIGDYVKVGLSKNDFVPAICYGTGEINDQTKFIIVIEAFENG